MIEINFIFEGGEKQQYLGRWTPHKFSKGEKDSSSWQSTHLLTQ